MALFYYEKTGTGPLVILLHGFPENGTLWNDIAGHLSVHFTVIVPDLPGSGKTPLLQPYSIMQMAEGIRDIMDAEGEGSAVIAGHSMGGYIAFAFGSLFPERTAGISAVHSSTSADDEEKKNSRWKTIHLIENGGQRNFIESMIPNLFSVYFKQSNKKIVDRKIAEALTMSREGLINFYQAMLDRQDSTEVLSIAHFPVQWIIGADDKVLDNKKIWVNCYKAKINFVSFYMNCGHMSMIEAPDLLVADLSEFINYSYTLPHV